MSQPSGNSAHSDRPNIDQKKKLAKELVKAVKRLDAAQAARFTWNHPKFRRQSGHDVVRDGVSLADAQHVIARESGFESWPKMTEYLDTLHREPGGPVAVFEDAVRAIIRGDASELQSLLRAHKELATMRSPRQHRATLPHYISANGVENEHQIVPPNAVEIAEALFAAGGDAVVDATADTYGGGGGSTPLVALVTSTHPHEAGVQPDLVRVFCKAGANPNGIDDDGLPIMSALGFRYPAAAMVLYECGARIDNLPTTAGVGQIELVRQYLDPDSRLVSKSCSFPNPGQITFPESSAPHPDETLQQALVFACMGGHREVAELLIDHGVDVNGGPRRGVRAIHEASYQGQLESIKLLLEHGADPTIRDGMWESTAIGWADGGKQPAIIDFLFEQDRVDILDAAELKRYEIVERLLTEDRSLANAPDGKGGALRFAAFHGDLKLAKLLLGAGADITLKNENGHTALDYAEKGGHLRVVELLRSKSNS
ncbi:MAG: hypothetical protein DHS20C16_07820 [Phycisphaerae bacterium]|nr:MAG: hypothetical protein DHS20C16_07820 [Phycisphaerae bacterium]